MYLYNVTLQRGGNVQAAIYGSFSGPKVHEIVVSRTKVLELLRPDANGKLQVIASTEVFGKIRSLCPFRLPGSNRDHIVVGSDSGRIVILTFDGKTRRFKKVHQETYGKTGCRRIVPGQYLAYDPKGRAVMIGALEKQKLVYVLNRDSAANLTISSPLEAHKSRNIVFSIVGLDCGFENPIFGAIEMDYGEAEQDPTGEAAKQARKHLTYYELDLGLNHVVRKWSEPCDNGANMLIAVPGGSEGPGGVLICAENYVIYKHQNHKEVKAPIPRRADLPQSRGVLLVSYAAHKQKSMFFFLVQSEYGDLYKVTLDCERETVKDLKIRYFDTIPVCTSICVLKSGFLFAGSECGDHALYQFLGIGDDENEAVASASQAMATENGLQPVEFSPRPLKNLLLIDAIESLSPVCDMKVANLFEEETKQMYTLTGKGPWSTMKILRPGQTVAEMAVSPLPGSPNGVWTIKENKSQEFDSFILVSFKNASLVLSVGESVEEVTDSGFQTTSATLDVKLMADDSILQVVPTGLRHILGDGRVNEWRCPGRKQITSVSCNERQVVAALTGYELVYFELDETGQLLESEKKDMAGEISSVCIAPIPAGKLRSKFLAIGGYDATIRVLSLDPHDCLSPLAVQAVAAVPSSMLFINISTSDFDEDTKSLYLQAGLANGILLRTEIDSVTGQLSDTRTRFLGTRPPKLVGLRIMGKESMMALSSRPWVGYTKEGRFTLTPISYEGLSHATHFSSEQCPEAIVGVAQTSLRILVIEHLGDVFNSSACGLKYTPRTMAVNEEQKVIAVGEADCGVVPNQFTTAMAPKENGDAMDTGEDDGENEPSEEKVQFGSVRGNPEQWASCIEVIDATSLSVSSQLELEGNYAVTCMAWVRFEGQEADILAVATALDIKLQPRGCSGGEIRLYTFKDKEKGLELLHSTSVRGIVRAMKPFQGRLLVGVGNALTLYELGKKQLLKKSENRKFPNFIVTIDTAGDRIYCGDAQESVHFCRYRWEDNLIHIYADDTIPRYMTASAVLDYNTVLGGDKFGNIFVCRLPKDVSKEVEDDPTGGRAMDNSSSALHSAPHKLESVCSFHLGDTVTAIQRTTMQPGGKEIVLYMTILGEIGALVPLTSKEDVDFFSHLEMHLRQDNQPLCGRDHLSYRSSYNPVRNVIDGGFCEQYSQISKELQSRIAEELDRSPGEVMKKLEDMRNKIL
ncbi:subunit 3 of splicing factor 3B [Chloropicon primus]|uniref:Subunit 3 of splicing factor 3B n=2 Tax=Chloropicon primus TaxID=1764295 RepID=A0A5B8MI58_9CHLO|nr:subunit 3 of splicing factor 3B [Chloropicon primus]|eukprot:QDZ20127.1 subunit 3 of splicing factor 3B [Chloropicon primus]